MMVALFYSGMIQSFIALGCMVRNGGLFKTFTYLRFYMKRSRINKAIANGTLPKEASIGSFGDYVLVRYSVQWRYYQFFVMSAILLAIYFAIFYIVG